MRIGYFPVMAGRKAGGVEVYELELLRALATLNADHTYEVFCNDSAAADAFGISERHVRFHLFRSPRPLAYSVEMWSAVRKQRCQVLHATYVPPLWCPVPMVFTLHDTSVFDFPDFYHARHRRLLQWWQKKGVRMSKHVLCPSEATKFAAERVFPEHAERLRFTALGPGQQASPIPAESAVSLVGDRFGVRKPFALYVGQLRLRHKNLHGLLQAFRLVHEKLGSACPVLILVGKKSWTTEDLEDRIRELNLSDVVCLTGHVTPAELAALYSAAQVLVSPSFSEGFGLTVVEAMAYSLPVIAARSTSLPEVVGNGGLLVDPFDPAEIAQAIVQVVTDAELRADLSARARMRAATFSWQKCAEETLRWYARG